MHDSSTQAGLDTPKQGTQEGAKPRRKRKGKFSLTDRKYAKQSRATRSVSTSVKDCIYNQEGCPSSNTRESGSQFSCQAFSSTGRLTVDISERVLHDLHGMSIEEKANFDVSP